MEHPLNIYNTLTRKKEQFIPLHEPHVGMYVCGPTVYGDAHLGHARPAITFDLLFRYLTHLGYKVRYVRNITDVGHLEHDADDGEDKRNSVEHNITSDSHLKCPLRGTFFICMIICQCCYLSTIRILSESFDFIHKKRRFFFIKSVAFR